MLNQQLVNYIQDQQQRGVAIDEIRKSLEASGWQKHDVSEAFMSLQKSATHNNISQVPNTEATLPGPTQLLREAWSIYTNRFWTLIGIILTPMILVLPLIALWGVSTTVGILLAKNSSSGSLGIIIIGIFILTIVSGIIISIWSQVSILYAIKDRNERIGVKEAYRRGWKKISSYLWATLLMGCIVIGGLILGIVPGIIFGTWFSLALFILVSEDLRGMNALLKSKEYVRGRWRGVFGRHLIAQLILIISMWAIPFVIAMVNPILARVVQILTSIIFSQIIIIYGFLIYENLRNIKGANVQVTSKKGKFVLFGILGILAPILITSVIVGLSSARQKARDAADRKFLTNGLQAQESQVSGAKAFTDEAWKYYEKGDFDLAITSFKKAHEIDPVTPDPSNPNFYWILGVIQGKKGNPYNAMDIYIMGLSIDKNNSNLICALGYAYEDKYLKDLKYPDNLDTAITYYQEGLGINPKSMYCRGYLAEAYYYMGNYSDAWRQVYLGRANGGEPPALFIKDLSQKMPDPGK